MHFGHAQPKAGTMVVVLDVDSLHILCVSICNKGMICMRKRTLFPKGPYRLGCNACRRDEYSR